MKALLLALLALWVVHHAMHPKVRTQRTPIAAGPADWFVIHPNGGGV